MELHPRSERIQAEGRWSGGSDGGGEEWSLSRVYTSLAAAYNWTYSEIDQHTLADANELFESWEDSPPTNYLVRAIVEGFGGKKFKSNLNRLEPVQVQSKSDQRKILSEISQQAGSTLPVLRKDPGLSQFKPEFDPEALNKKNLALRVKYAKKDSLVVR